MLLGSAGEEDSALPRGEVQKELLCAGQIQVGQLVRRSWAGCWAWGWEGGWAGEAQRLRSPVRQALTPFSGIWWTHRSCSSNVWDVRQWHNPARIYIEAASSSVGSRELRAPLSQVYWDAARHWWWWEGGCWLRQEAEVRPRAAERLGMTWTKEAVGSPDTWHMDSGGRIGSRAFG